MVKHLLYYQLKRTLRYFYFRRAAKIFTLTAFVGVFGGIAWGLYHLFLEGFSYIDSYPFFAQALTLYSYEIYLLLITLLIVISAFISASFTLFQTRETTWVMTTPSYKELFRFIFLQTFITSLWPLLIIALPSIFAINAVFGLSWTAVALSIISIGCLTMSAVASIFILILILGKILHSISRRIGRNHLNFKNLTTSIAVILLVVMSVIWASQFHIDLISLFKAQDLNKQSAGIQAISQNFALSPAHPVAASIFHLQTGNKEEAYALFSLLLAITAGAVGIIWWLSRWYLSIWQRLQEGSFTARTNKEPRSRTASPRYFLGSPTVALFKKEVLTSTRNLKNVMWFTFLLIIWMIQTGTNLILSKNLAQYEINIELFPVIAHTLQFLTGIFFISAFVLRFVFPSFSMERNTAWILASSPIRKTRIFWSKLLFYLPIFLLLGLGIGYSNLLILDISFSYTLSTFVLFFASIVFIVTLGLSLGAIFPSFETDDPAKLSTSMPGIGFILGALTYGGVSALFLYQALIQEGYQLFSLMLITSFALILGLIYSALSSLKEKEFVKKQIS